MLSYRPDDEFSGFMDKVRKQLKEAEQLNPDSQKKKDEEKPELDAETIGVEDYSEEDLNATPPKPAPRSKSKDDERYAVKEVPDKDVQNPAPAKESKGYLLLCNNCFKTCRNTEDICTECRSNMVERIVEDVTSSGSKSVEQMDDEEKSADQTEEIANVILRTLVGIGIQRQPRQLLGRIMSSSLLIFQRSKSILRSQVRRCQRTKEGVYLRYA